LVAYFGRASAKHCRGLVRPALEEKQVVLGPQRPGSAHLVTDALVELPGGEDPVARLGQLACVEPGRAQARTTSTAACKALPASEKAPKTASPSVRTITPPRRATTSRMTASWRALASSQRAPGRRPWAQPSLRSHLRWPFRDPPVSRADARWGHGVDRFRAAHPRPSRSSSQPRHLDLD
jgi:hypothetical protein